MRAAKALAAERGETLKEMFTRLLTAEVRAPHPSRPRSRVALPLVGDPSGPPVEMSNDDIESALDDDDVEKYSR